MPRNTLPARPYNRQFANAKSFWENQQDVMAAGRSTLPVYTLRHTRGITAPSGGASAVTLSNLYKQEAYMQAAMKRDQNAKSVRSASRDTVHTRAPSWITPQYRNTISRCVLRSRAPSTDLKPDGSPPSDIQRPVTPNLGSETTASRAEDKGSRSSSPSWAAELLDAFLAAGLLRKSSVLTSNPDLPELLLGQWLSDTPLDLASTSEQIVQIVLQQNLSVLGVSSTGDVYHRDPGSPFPCGCSGGALWRCRFTKQQKRYPHSRWLSKIASWAERPEVEPLYDGALHPDVESLVLQYLGESCPCETTSVCSSCPKRWRGYYLTASGSDPTTLKAAFLAGFRQDESRPKSSQMKLQRLTPLFDLQASLFKVYSADRKRRSCHIFHGNRRIALVQNEHSVLARLPAHSQDHATLHSIKCLVKTSRAAERFLRRAGRSKMLGPVMLPSILTKSFPADPMHYLLSDDEEETCSSRQCQSVPMVPYLDLENTTSLRADNSLSDDGDTEDDYFDEEEDAFAERRALQDVQTCNNNEITFRVMSHNETSTCITTTT